MSVISTPKGLYRKIGYSKEVDLEAAIHVVKADLFGPNRIYLDVKKKIGAKGGIKNIPDGYLIDLNGKQPRLYVVENELNAHDPLHHIAVQVLKFSLSFEAEPYVVKKILLTALHDQVEVKTLCEQYALTHGFHNLDNMLDRLIFETPFAALVIIDEMPDNLENILIKKFQFGVEVLELARYVNSEGEHLYHFEPFLADLTIDAGSTYIDTYVANIDTNEIDTIVVPARQDGFQETFIAENCWYAIRNPRCYATADKIYCCVSGRSSISHYAYCSRQVY